MLTIKPLFRAVESELTNPSLLVGIWKYTKSFFHDNWANTIPIDKIPLDIMLIQKGLAANPNSPLDVLIDLSHKYPYEVLSNVAFDLHLLRNPYLLWDFFGDNVNNILAMIMICQNDLLWPYEFTSFFLNQWRSYYDGEQEIELNEVLLCLGEYKPNHVARYIDEHEVDFFRISDGYYSDLEFMNIDFSVIRLQNATFVDCKFFKIPIRYLMWNTFEDCLFEDLTFRWKVFTTNELTGCKYKDVIIDDSEETETKILNQSSII
jgi:hypothetical protein